MTPEHQHRLRNQVGWKIKFTIKIVISMKVSRFENYKNGLAQDWRNHFGHCYIPFYSKRAQSWALMRSGRILTGLGHHWFNPWYDHQGKWTSHQLNGKFYLEKIMTEEMELWYHNSLSIKKKKCHDWCNENCCCYHSLSINWKKKK